MNNGNECLGPKCTPKTNNESRTVAHLDAHVPLYQRAVVLSAVRFGAAAVWWRRIPLIATRFIQGGQRCRQVVCASRKIDRGQQTSFANCERRTLQN